MNTLTQVLYIVLIFVNVFCFLKSVSEIRIARAHAQFRIPASRQLLDSWTTFTKRWSPVLYCTALHCTAVIPLCSAMISRYRLLQSVCLTTRIPKRTAATAAAGQVAN